MSVGFGKIVETQNGPEYSLTQVYWNVDTLDWDADSDGFERVTAYDPFGAGSRDSGDIVQFTYQEAMDGQAYPIISDGLGLPPLPTVEGEYYLEISVDDEGFQTFSYGGVEGGSSPTAVDADEGWIYKYNRAGVTEIAHAKQRDEVVQYDNTENCWAHYVFDDRGHCIGWWKENGATWESPWGFSEPTP